MFAGVLVVTGAVLGGCASRGGPEVLAIEPAVYATAFETAQEAAREAGLPPMFRDVRAGVIETEPQIVGSLLEPWRYDDATLPTLVEGTVSMQRRRARFEFLPVGFEPAAPDGEAPLAGPDLLALDDEPRPDLTEMADGPIELRVWVYVERKHVRGMRRDTWTRQATSVAVTDPPGVFWTPAGRDPAFERRLLAEVAARLAAAVDRAEPEPEPEPSDTAADG